MLMKMFFLFISEVSNLIIKFPCNFEAYFFEGVAELQKKWNQKRFVVCNVENCLLVASHMAQFKLSIFRGDMKLSVLLDIEVGLWMQEIFNKRRRAAAQGVFNF